MDDFRTPLDDLRNTAIKTLISDPDSVEEKIERRLRESGRCELRALNARWTDGAEAEFESPLFDWAVATAIAAPTKEARDAYRDGDSWHECEFPGRFGSPTPVKTTPGVRRTGPRGVHAAARFQGAQSLRCRLRSNTSQEATGVHGYLDRTQRLPLNNDRKVERSLNLDAVPMRTLAHGRRAVADTTRIREDISISSYPAVSPGAHATKSAKRFETPVNDRTNR